MKILFITQRQVGDRSFGGAMRANAVRDALASVAATDTLVITGGSEFSVGATWDAERIRGATFSRWGLSRQAVAQRRAMSRWIAQIIDDEHYDLIVAHYLDLALLLPARERQQMIFESDDFQKFDDAAPLLARVKLAIRNRIARRVARQARHVWFNNPSPAQTPPTSRRSLLPNIVALPDPARTRSPMTKNRILMVGLFEYPPNSEALIWFHDAILPGIVAKLPDAELHAVGRHDPAVADRLPNVHFHGFVDNLAAEYDKAALVIAPVRSGSGTQIKVIDALAHARPVIVSPFAHSGFAADLHDGSHLLVAGSPEQWVDRCVWALTHADEASIIANAGETIVRDRYSPAAMQRAVAATIASIAPRRRS